MCFRNELIYLEQMKLDYGEESRKTHSIYDFFFNYEYLICES